MVPSLLGRGNRAESATQGRFFFGLKNVCPTLVLLHAAPACTFQPVHVPLARGTPPAPLPLSLWQPRGILFISCRVRALNCSVFPKRRHTTEVALWQGARLPFLASGFPLRVWFVLMLSAMPISGLLPARWFLPARCRCFCQKGAGAGGYLPPDSWASTVVSHLTS